MTKLTGYELARKEWGGEIKDWMKHTIDGITYIMLQDAYLAGTYEDDYYEARAIAEDGTRAMLRWEILDSYDPAAQDESDACDWDSPSVAKVYEDDVDGEEDEEAMKMGFEESYIEARNLWSSELRNYTTDDRDEFERDATGQLIFVADRTPVIDAIADELQAGTYYTRDEDICGFLTRHGIEWE